MNFQYEQTRADVQAASRLISYKLKYFLIGCWLLVALLISPVVYEGIAHPENAEGRGSQLFAQFLPLVLLGFFFLALSRLQPWIAARRAILRTVEWTLTDQGVHMATEVSSGDLSWAAFVKFREDDNVMLLFVQKSQAQFIPKRILSEAEQNELRTLIQAHVKN